MVSVTAMAQNVEQQVQKIRKVYQEVKARAASDLSPYEGGMGIVTVKGKANYCATGPQDNDITIYAEHHQDMDDYFNTYDAVLITQSFNIAARKYYREYLYDIKTFKLIFSLQNDECNSDAPIVKRFYFSNDGGIYWNSSETCVFPNGFDCGDVFTMTVDDNNFLWLFCGKSGQVWKGRMSAKSGKNYPTSFTE